MSVAENIGLGDVVRLRSGETVTVDSVYDSYTDVEGEHPGPFLTPRGNLRERYLLSEVAEVVQTNPRRCVYCGEGVTSTNPETDFCRNCFYTGRAHEERRADLLLRIRALDGVESASVWHTGGGCFLLAVQLADGRLLTPSEGYRDINGEVWGEPGIPGPEGPWALVTSATEQAWEEWTDDGQVKTFDALLSDDELVAAVADLAARPGALEAE